MRFRIAVCDDDIIYLNQLKASIEDIIEQKRIDYDIEIFSSGQALLEEIRNGNTFHGIFLNVQLNNENGLDISKEVKKHLKNTYVVLVSTFINYAVSGYRVDACRFLLKGGSEFDSELEEAIDYISKNYLADIRWEIFSFIEGKEKVRLNEISYIESHGHLLYFHIWQNGGLVKRTLREKLDIIEEQIASINYCRIHKSYLINMRDMQKVDGNMVILKYGKSMKISQSRMKNVQEEYEEYRGRE